MSKNRGNQDGSFRKCGICGRFISLADIESEEAVRHEEPDDVMADSPSEGFWWNHLACEMKEIGGSPR